ncbi:MAG: winged helix-turn-helix domain-containing protein [Nitrospiraceae bacterium]
MNELIVELERKVAGVSADAPYCVLSRELVRQLIVALGQPQAEDPWLLEIQGGTTPIEFRIYRALYQAKGRIVEHASLLGSAGVATLESLWVHVRRLRMKVEAHGWGKIETVRERGYFLEVERE